jgi:hypothetical protein
VASGGFAQRRLTRLGKKVSVSEKDFGTFLAGSDHRIIHYQSRNIDRSININKITLTIKREMPFGQLCEDFLRGKASFQALCPKGGGEMPTFLANSRKDKSALSEFVQPLA